MTLSNDQLMPLAEESEFLDKVEVALIKEEKKTKPRN